MGMDGQRAARMAVVWAIVVCVVLLPATAGASTPRGTSKMSEKALRKLEKRLLGTDHAREHAMERATQRRDARLIKAGKKPTRALPRARAAAVGPTSEVGAWDPTVGTIAINGSATKGMPAIHAALLPTGKVLWFGYRLEGGTRYKKEALAALWDPVTKSLKAVLPPIDPATGRPAALYCSGMSLMPDGRLLVTGGYLNSRTNPTTGIPEYDGLKHTYTLNPFTEKWQRHEDMDDGRWYPSQMLMPDGRTFIIQGLDGEGTGDNSGNFSRQLEIFDPSKPLGQEVDRMSRDLTTSEDGDWYPHTYWMPSGRGLIAGPAKENSWLFLPPSPLNFTKVEAADPLRTRIWGAGVLLPLNHDSTRGTAWQIGGSLSKSRNALNTNTAEAYSESSNQWTAAPSQNIARSHENAVLLPDGGIAALGGGYGNRGTNWDSGPEHRQMEYFDPATRTWKLGPAQQKDRSYHSTAVLLPDGSVVSAGDDRDRLNPIDTYEIYKPPYFFKGTRPVLSSAPSSTGYGRTIWVGTPDTDITRAVLVAPGATTHGVDMHQRVVNLPARRRSDGVGYDIDTPLNANVALPGYYMLFLLDDQGRPSFAKWIKVDRNAPAQDPPTGAVDTTPPPAPSVTPASGTYSSAQQVSMSDSEPGVAIRYTVGSGTSVPADPTAASTEYTGPITVSSSQVVKAAAFDAAGNRSAITQRDYTISMPTGGTTRTVTVPVLADTMVNENLPTTGHGTATRLKLDYQVGTDTTSALQAYLKFDIPALAAGETITSAALSLEVTNDTENGPHVYRTGTGWAEPSLTWDTRNNLATATPPGAGPISTTAIGDAGSMLVGRRTIQLSGITSSGLHSFEVRQLAGVDSGNDLIFASKDEPTVAYRPTLVLTVSTP